MIERHPHLIAIRFASDLSAADRRRVVARAPLAPWNLREELPGESFTIFRVAPTREPVADRLSRAEDHLRAHRHVVHVTPVFRHGRSRWLVADRIAVALAGRDRAAIRALTRRGARVLDETDAQFLLELPAGVDALAECARLGRRPSVAWAEPDFVLLHRRSAAPASRLATTQPAMSLIGAPAAWRRQHGEASVVVAVLDGGVLVSHPDLEAAVSATYDATSGGTRQTPKPWDSHGTACAGLAVGTHGGGRHGVRGVAAGCGLAAVRIGYTPTRISDFVTRPSWLARGVDWAWRHGASVLSLSLGGGPRSAAVTAALERARTRGRNGKGCVIAAAAGNGATPDDPVEFPASLPFVLGVAATDDQGRPKSSTSRGGPWTSCSGPEVDLAAPGVGCYTCTVPDPTENAPGLYTRDFSGTSAATPLVAGAAALVLSANPGLTEEEVRNILCETAVHPRGAGSTGSRNDAVGFGRLDVLTALRRVVGRAAGSPNVRSLHSEASRHR